MSIFIHFSLAFFLSLLGTIPLGIITLTLADVTIQRGLKAGIFYSLGASVMEFVYTFVALKFINLFLAQPTIETSIQWAAMIVFSTLALYYLLSQAKTPETSSTETDYKFSFFKGLGISSLNMLIVPYWIFLGSWLHAEEWIVLENFWILIFSLGATLGALAVFLLYAKISELIVRKSASIAKITHKIIGFIFLALAIYQLTQILQ